ncbi:hypothetical protein FNF27_05138 [Cafeteria roenbergensis]|uniref:Uncharacterized protein n=1 Tax=Cafeteria roenbergensis TaxID=33653 RepID=A0A5A8EBW9_CAFRO|nr:hypothetical protein FNF27_05138 [Cafeteria roenbergensis]
MDLLVDFGAAVSNFSEQALNLTNLKTRGEAEIVQASATNQAAGKRWRVPLEVNATGGDAISIAVSVRVGPDSATLPQLTGNASLLLGFGLVRPSDIAVMSGATPSALTPRIVGVADASMNLWVVVSFPLAVNTMRLQHFVLQGLKEAPGAKPVALQDAPSLETLSSSLDSGAKHWALRVTPIDLADSASANTRLSDECELGNTGCVNQAPSISSHATGVTLGLRSVATALQVVEWDAELQTPKNTMALNSSASSASCFAVIATFMTGLRSLDVADFRLAGLSASISTDDCGSANLGQQLPNSTDANGRVWRLLVVPLESGKASVSLKDGLGTSSPSYTLGPSVHDRHFELRVQVTSLDWLTCAANPCQALTSSATTDRSLALRVTFNRPVAHFVAARDLALVGLAVSGESSDPGPRAVWEVHLVPTAERSDVSATVLPFRSGLCNGSEAGSSWSWASGPATSCSLATPRIAATGPMAAALQVQAKPTALGFYKQPVLDPGSKIAPDTAASDLWVVADLSLPVCGLPARAFVLSNATATLSDPVAVRMDETALSGGCSSRWAMHVQVHDRAGSIRAEVRHMASCDSLDGQADDDGCFAAPPSPLLEAGSSANESISLRTRVTSVSVFEGSLAKAGERTLAEQVRSGGSSSETCFTVVVEFERGVSGLEAGDVDLVGLEATECSMQTASQPQSDATGQRWLLHVSVGAEITSHEMGAGIRPSSGRAEPEIDTASAQRVGFSFLATVKTVQWLTCAANPCQALTSSATTDRSLALRVTFNRPVAHFVAARDLALVGLAVSGESSDPGPRAVWEVHLVPTAERSDVSATVLPFRSGLCNGSEAGSSWSWASGPATSCSLATPRIAATGPMAAALQVQAKPTALGFYKQPVLDPGSKIAPDTAASDLWVVADLSLPVCGLPARAFVLSNATATLSDPVAVRMDETALSGGCSSRWAMHVQVHDRAGSIRAEVRHMASCDSLDGQADDDGCFAAPPSPLLEAGSSANASISLRTRVTSVSVFEGSLAKAGERTLAEQVRSGGSSSETCFTVVVEFERGVSGLEAGDVDLVGLEATECSTQTASQPQSDATGQRWLLHVSVGAEITSHEMGAGIRPSSGRTDPSIDVSQAPSATFEFRSRVASVEVAQLTASEGAGEPPFPATSTLRVRFLYERPVRDFDASRDAWLVGGRFVAGSQAAIEPSGWEFHVTPTGSTAEVLVVALHWQNRSCDWTSGASRSAMSCSVTVPRVAADGKAVRVAHAPVSVEPEDAKLLPYPAIAKSISLDGTSVTVNNFWVLITFEQPVANVPLSAFGFVGLEPFSSLDRNDLSIEYLSTPAAVQANASELLGWDCQGCSRFWSLFVKASGGTNSLSFFAAEASTCPNEDDQCVLPRPLVESSGAIKSGDVQFRSSVVKLEFVEVLNRGQSFAVVSDGGFVTSQCLSARVTFAEGVRNLTASHFRLQTVEARDCDKGNAASVPAPVAGDETVWQLPVTLALGDLDKEFSFVVDADAQPPSVPNFVATSMRTSATFRARVNTVRLLDSRTGADLSGGLITSDSVEIVTELSSPVARFQTKLDMWVIGGTVVWEEFSAENADQARNTWRANATIDPGASVFYVETKPSQAYLCATALCPSDLPAPRIVALGAPASAPHRVMATQKAVAVWEDDNGDGRPGDGEQRVANGGVTSARCLSVRVAFGSGIRGLTAKHFDLRGLLPQRCRPHASSAPAEPSEAVQLDAFGAEWALGVVVAPEAARVTAGLFEPGTADSPMTSPSYRVTSSALALEYRVRLLGMSLWEVAGAVGAQTPAGREVTAGSTSATRLKLRVQFEGPVRGLSAGRDISLDGLRVVEESPDSGPDGQHFADVWNITVEPTGERSDVTATLVPFEEHVCVGGEGPASVAWSGGDAPSSCSAAVPRLAGYGPSGHVVGTTFFAVPVGVTFRSEPSTDSSFVLETVTVLSSVWAVVEYSVPFEGPVRGLSAGRDISLDGLRVVEESPDSGPDGQHFADVWNITVEPTGERSDVTATLVPFEEHVCVGGEGPASVAWSGGDAPSSCSAAVPRLAGYGPSGHVVGTTFFAVPVGVTFRSEPSTDSSFVLETVTVLSSVWAVVEYSVPVSAVPREALRGRYNSLSRARAALVRSEASDIAIVEDTNGDGRPGDGEQRVANGGVTSARCLSVRVAFGSGIRGLTAKHFDLRGLLPQRCRPHASTAAAEPSEAVQLDAFGAEWALGVVVAPEAARVTAGLFEPGTAGTPMTSPSYRVTSSALALEYRVRLLGMSLWEVAGAVGAQTPAGREVTAGSTSATRLKLRVQFEGPVRGLSAGRDISLDGLRVVEESPDSGPDGQHFADVWNITVEPTGERSDVTATLVPFEEHVCVGGEGPASVAWSGGDAASSCSAAVPRLAGYGPSGHVVGTTFFAVPVGVTFRVDASLTSPLLTKETSLLSMWAVVDCQPSRL